MDDLGPMGASIGVRKCSERVMISNAVEVASVSPGQLQLYESPMNVVPLAGSVSVIFIHGLHLISEAPKRWLNASSPNLALSSRNSSMNASAEIGNEASAICVMEMSLGAIESTSETELLSRERVRARCSESELGLSSVSSVLATFSVAGVGGADVGGASTAGVSASGVGGASSSDSGEEADVVDCGDLGDVSGSTVMVLRRGCDAGPDDSPPGSSTRLRILPSRSKHSSRWLPQKLVNVYSSLEAVLMRSAFWKTMVVVFAISVMDSYGIRICRPRQHREEIRTETSQSSV